LPPAPGPPCYVPCYILVLFVRNVRNNPSLLFYIHAPIGTTLSQWKVAERSGTLWCTPGPSGSHSLLLPDKQFVSVTSVALLYSPKLLAVCHPVSINGDSSCERFMPVCLWSPLCAARPSFSTLKESASLRPSSISSMRRPTSLAGGSHFGPCIHFDMLSGSRGAIWLA
jgi:hypothetical protein